MLCSFNFENAAYVFYRIEFFHQFNETQTCCIVLYITGLWFRKHVQRSDYFGINNLLTCQLSFRRLILIQLAPTCNKTASVHYCFHEISEL